VRARLPLLWLLACTNAPLEEGRGGYGLENIESAAHLADPLFSQETLPEFRLELSEESLQSLRDEPYIYVEGVLVYGQERIADVGIRTKGNKSWQPIDDKPSLKVKLNWSVPGQRFRGLEELTFNAMNDDHSMMHERIGYALYREAGVPSARATHAVLMLNEESYGLYTHLETVDEHLIERWFSDDSGALFELNDADYSDDYLAGFELKFADDESESHLDENLLGVAEALTIEDPDSAMAAVEAHLQLDQFLLYWAVSAVIGQFDGYPYSIPGDDSHVYDDPESGRLHTLPHGIDESFYQSTKDVFTSTVGLLASRCLESSDCRSRLETQLETVLSLMETMNLYDRTLAIQAQIAPLIEADMHHSHDERDIEFSQQYMLDFIAERREEITSQIQEYR
jgi:spore coat protein CotH